MISVKHLHQLKTKVRHHFPNPEINVFVFGSSVRENVFRDIDVGFQGDIDERVLSELREELENSNFPYTVALVDFTYVDEDFKDFVLHKEVKKWI